jgi:hypothetical protein
VYQIRREMPASELADWYAHFKLVIEEQERAAKKAKR